MDKRKKIGFLHPLISAMLSPYRFSQCRVKWEIADVNDSSKSVVLTHASPQKRRKVTSRKQNNIHRPLPSASFIRNRFLLRLFLISDYVLENLPFSRRLCDATVYANIIIVESSPFWEILPVAEAAKKVDTMCL